MVSYLITGANRGIGTFFFVRCQGARSYPLSGLALAKETLSTQSNAIVFAGTRNPANSPALHSLAVQHTDRLHIVNLVSADFQSNEAVAKEILDKYGRVDVVIANAGQCFSGY